MLERLGGRMIGEQIALAGCTLGLHPIWSLGVLLAGKKKTTKKGEFVALMAYQAT